jgi:hypothetical protein
MTPFKLDNKIKKSMGWDYLSFNANSGFNFFFSICCLAKSVVTSANAPTTTLPIPNIAVPLKIPAVVIPKAPVASPHGILLFFHNL